MPVRNVGIMHQGVLKFASRAESIPRGKVFWTRIWLREGGDPRAHNSVFLKLITAVNNLEITPEGGVFGDWSLQLLMSSDRELHDVSEKDREFVSTWLEDNVHVEDFVVGPVQKPEPELAILEKELARAQAKWQPREEPAASGKDPEPTAAGSAKKRSWWKFWAGN